MSESKKMSRCLCGKVKSRYNTLCKACLFAESAKPATPAEPVVVVKKEIPAEPVADLGLVDCIEVVIAAYHNLATSSPSGVYACNITALLAALPNASAAFIEAACSSAGLPIYPNYCSACGREVYDCNPETTLRRFHHKPLPKAEAAPVYDYCIFEDCDQTKEPGSVYCDWHKKHEEAEEEVQRKISGGAYFKGKELIDVKEEIHAEAEPFNSFKIYSGAAYTLPAEPLPAYDENRASAGDGGF